MTLAAILAAGTTIIGSIVVVLSYVLGGKSAKRKEDLEDAIDYRNTRTEIDKITAANTDTAADRLRDRIKRRDL